MKIVYVTSAYLPHIGGLENCVASIAENFARNNDVVVITADIEIDSVKTENINGIKTIRLPAISLSGIIILKKYRYNRIILNELRDADIVHHNDCKFLYRFLANNKKKFNYKLYISSHGFIFHTNSNLWLKKLFFKFIVAKKKTVYDKFICVSEQDEQIAKNYKINNTTVIYPGVDIYKFCDLSTSKSSIDEFVYWGRIAPNKGIIEAIKKLSELKENYKVTFIGKCEDSNYKQEIENAMEKYGNKENISFVGPQSDEYIKSIVASATFILLPSLHEGFGMTLAECLLSTKKIIANTNDSYVQILKSVNATEYLFDFQNEQTDLNLKVNELRLKNIIPQNVEQYSDSEMFRRILEVYNE